MYVFLVAVTAFYAAVILLENELSDFWQLCQRLLWLALLQQWRRLRGFVAAAATEVLAAVTVLLHCLIICQMDQCLCFGRLCCSSSGSVYLCGGGSVCLLGSGSAFLCGAGGCSPCSCDFVSAVQLYVSCVLVTCVATAAMVCSCDGGGACLFDGDGGVSCYCDCFMI